MDKRADGYEVPELNNIQTHDTGDVKQLKSLGKVAFNRAAPKTLELDLARYEAMLDDQDMSEEDKQALIEALWSVVVSFVEMGFNVHPIQQALEDKGCGQVEEDCGADSGTLLLFDDLPDTNDRKGPK